MLSPGERKRERQNETESQRNADTAVSAADAILLSMTQIESWMFPASRRRSKLLTLLTMEARRGVFSESSSRHRGQYEVHPSCDYVSLLMAAEIVMQTVRNSFFILLSYKAFPSSEKWKYIVTVAWCFNASIKWVESAAFGCLLNSLKSAVGRVLDWLQWLEDYFYVVQLQKLKFQSTSKTAKDITESLEYSDTVCYLIPGIFFYALLSLTNLLLLISFTLLRNVMFDLEFSL